MKCQNCGKNEVNVHLKQNINGAVSEYALCSECAEKMGFGGIFESFGSFGGFGGLSGLGGFGGFGGFGGMESLLGSMFGHPAAKTLPKHQQCELCGSSFEDIANRGKVGCPKCYDTFADRLAPSIERIHGRAKHIGKLPGKAAAQPAPKSAPAEPKKPVAEDKNTKIKSLRLQLEQAIAREEYEKAAVLRDQIKELENK